MAARGEEKGFYSLRFRSLQKKRRKEQPHRKYGCMEKMQKKLRRKKGTGTKE